MAAVDRFDEIIKEYLLFRGFGGSFKSFESELKNEKDKGYRVDKIMEQIHQSVNTHDLASLKDVWSFLNNRLFCRLDQSYAAAVKKLENSLLKHYVINCIQSNRNDKLQEFFEKMSTELQPQQEWREWFMLAWCKCPEDDKAFSMYFNKQWQDTLYLSLQNFLSVIIQAMPTPKHLSQDAEIRKIKKLEDENAKLRQQVKDISEKRDVSPKGRGPSQSSLSESILSPTGAMSGPTAMDLMDDFYVISQDTIIEDSPKPKSQPIKSFLSSIGRSSPGTTRKQLDEQKAAPPSNKNGAKITQPPSTGKKQDQGGYNRSKSDPSKTPGVQMRNKSSNIPSAVTAKEGRVERPRSVDVSAAATSSAASQSKVAKDKKPEVNRDPPKQAATSHLPGSQSSHRDSSGSQSSQTHSTGSQSSQVNTAIKEQPTSGFTENAALNGEKLEQSSAGAGAVYENWPVVTGSAPFSLLSQEEYGEHQSSITRCRFSGSGHSVATLDVDGVVKVWGLQPSPVTTATVMSKSMLQCVEWAGKSDKWLLLGSKAGSVRLFDVSRKQIERETNVDNVYTRVSALSCNPQGTHFACAASGRKKVGMADAGARGGRLTVWNLETMQIQKKLLLGAGTVVVTCICYSDTGQLILTGASDGHVRLYELYSGAEGESGESVMQWTAHQGEVYTVAFSGDARTCYTMGSDGKFIEWSLSKAGHRLSELGVHAGASGPFVLAGAAGYRQVQTAKGRLFAFNADHNYAITCASDGGCIYNVKQTPSAGKSTECVMLLKGHKAPVVSVDWSSSTETMMCLSASMDGKVRVSTLLAH